MGSKNKAVYESGSWKPNNNSNLGPVIKKLTRYDDIKEEEEAFPDDSSKDLEQRSLASSTPMMIKMAN
jgi:hypothetical protein